MTVFSHVPVMLDEIVDVFGSVPSGVILDATLGGAGHSEALLDARADISILGLDQDASALAAARTRLARFGDRAIVRHCRFDRLVEAMGDTEVEQLSGALFDLGVSSHQFDEASRGFSYRTEAPLDMRMDVSHGRSAADIVNDSTEKDLAELIHRFSDERFARRIARSICANRPIRTTAELASIVASAIPAPARRRGGHPAKRTFQALRIAVNEELDVLPVAIDAAIENTTSGGRVAVLSYHSGEDRIVKERFAFHRSGGCSCPTNLPCVCGAVARVDLVRAPSKPSASELERNPRSASARLRVVEVR